MSNKEGELPPFFMEKIAREKRAQFRVIEGSGNNYNSIDSRMSFLMGRVYLEDAILRFFDYVGLNHEDIDEANPDPTYIKNTFNNFIGNFAEHEEDPYQRLLLKNLSLEKVADMCEQKLKAAIYTLLRSIASDEIAIFVSLIVLPRKNILLTLCIYPLF